MRRPELFFRPGISRVHDFEWKKNWFAKDHQEISFDPLDTQQNWEIFIFFSTINFKKLEKTSDVSEQQVQNWINGSKIPFSHFHFLFVFPAETYKKSSVLLTLHNAQRSPIYYFLFSDKELFFFFFFLVLVRRQSII